MHVLFNPAEAVFLKQLQVTLVQKAEKGILRNGMMILNARCLIVPS